MRGSGALSVLALVLSLGACTAVPPARPAPAAAPATEPPDPPVSGAAMIPTNPIGANLAAVTNLSTFARAVQASSRAAMLSGTGAYTVLAPTDAAFARLAPGTLDDLFKPENRTAVTTLVNFHIVPGAFTLADLRARISAGGGSASIPTLSGEPLTATLQGNTVALADSAGNKSYIEVADLRQSNGMVQIVNGVLVPRALR